MFRSAAARHGTYVAAGTSYAGLQWRFQTNGTVRSSPVVSGGVVYVGSSDGGLYAIDERTGARRWRYDAGSAVTSSPAVANGTVFAQSYAGVVVALDARTGARRWIVRTGPRMRQPWGHESGDFYISSPVVSGGTVYIGAGDGYLYALRAADGSARWRAKTGGRIRSTPAIADGVAYVGSYDGKLYAFDANTGARRWAFATLGAGLNSASFGYDRRSIQSSPAVAGGEVFFGSRDGNVYAIDTTTGRERWHFDHVISWSNTSPAVDRGLVMAGSSDKVFVQGLDAVTGKERWRFTTALNVFGSPSVAGETVYDGDWAGNLYAIDERNGVERWRFHTSGAIFSTPAIADECVFFGSDDGGVYALNLTRGPGLHKAVFYDEASAKRGTLASSAYVSTYFKNRGYELLDAAHLDAYLAARTADREPSTVVFATDDAPTGQLMPYLKAGGRAVWLGIPPRLMDYSEKDQGRGFDAIDRSGARAYLGVGFEDANFDTESARPTALGERYGLGGWWTSTWDADAKTVTSVLAYDEMGDASAWLKTYGSRPGSGFLRVPVVEIGPYPTNLIGIRAAAEYFPRA